MPTLVDLEVDEVSLVDRPATGRKFRIFKRDAIARGAAPKNGSFDPRRNDGAMAVARDAL
jgi:hypothetical protein